ncbi:MAG: DUF3052 domain-containing protein [Salinibacterium sp.]|nr:MAG: DUF3052 domain-containing protein [Salinibacterium sp.]
MATGGTAGYSGTPQLKKLGIVPGIRLSIVGAPSGWVFEREPDAVELVPEDAPADVVLAFFHNAEQLDARIEALGERIRPAGSLWIAWPRRAGGHMSDITDNYIREVVLPRGLVDVKVAAIDNDWSGLKVVWRLVNR